MKKILTDAVAIGNACARANTVFPRDPGQRVYKGTDSEWVMAFGDKDTYFLKDGARRMDSRLHVPANVPVKDNWSVTIYDTQTRSMLQTDQEFAGVNSLGKGLKPNADGSYDVIFAPKQPKGVDQRNWIQTIPKKSWFILFRAYGPLEPWLDQTWRPSELELAN